ncbi:hypothetical protein D3C72_454040 [compost metagenome]
MKREPPTVEDLEAFSEQLNGPLGVALRAAGVIIERRMRERGQAWADLNDSQVVDLFVAAFMEAAPTAYSSSERSVVEAAVEAMARSIYMELAATADGSRALN